MRAGRPSLTARWAAARRAPLARTRPSTPAGDVAGERALTRDVTGLLAVPAGLPRPAGIARRTAFIDNEVAAALGRGIEQLVIVGAGYDGRALRFGGGAARWFEVDFPSTQADKRRRLAALGVATDGVTFVPLDLMTGNLGAALDAEGHDAGAPTLFVCEGLFGYLTLEASASVLGTLRARAAEHSVLVATFLVTPEARGAPRATRDAFELLLRLIGEPKRHEFRPGDPKKLVVVTGWRVERSQSGAASRLDAAARSMVLACGPTER